jgi:hypothetical protein
VKREVRRIVGSVAATKARAADVPSPALTPTGLAAGSNPRRVRGAVEWRVGTLARGARQAAAAWTAASIAQNERMPSLS